MKETLPSIETYYDNTAHGILRNSRDFFELLYTNRSDQNYFFELRNAPNAEKLFSCGCCGNPLVIRGTGEKGKKRLYFCHCKGEGVGCAYYKKSSSMTKDEMLKLKFHGQRVGYRHEFIKHFVNEHLNKMEGVNSVEERIMHSETFDKQWRRPDITVLFSENAISNEVPITLVIEIQLSTTFLNVITERNQFYAKNEKYILWIFNDRFSPISREQVFA
jgi:hypothetical protein